MPKKTIEVQICRVSLITDMVDEELARYFQYHREVEKWRLVEPLDWGKEPRPISKSILRDRMKMLRQEMVKLDKMLQEAGQ